MDFPRSWTTCPESVVLSLQKLPDIEVHELSIDAPDRVAYILLQQRAPMHKVNALNSFYALFKIFAKTLPWSTEEINHIC